MNGLLMRVNQIEVQKGIDRQKYVDDVIADLEELTVFGVYYEVVGWTRHFETEREAVNAIEKTIKEIGLEDITLAPCNGKVYIRRD